jgi:hypothetical protein
MCRGTPSAAHTWTEPPRPQVRSARRSGDWRSERRGPSASARPHAARLDRERTGRSRLLLNLTQCRQAGPGGPDLDPAELSTGSQPRGYPWLTRAVVDIARGCQSPDARCPQVSETGSIVGVRSWKRLLSALSCRYSGARRLLTADIEQGTRPSTRLRDQGRSRNGNPELATGKPRPREALPQDGSRATARRSRVPWTARQSICTSLTYPPPEGASGHVLASSSPARAVIETLPRPCHAQPPRSPTQGAIRHPLLPPCAAGWPEVVVGHLLQGEVDAKCLIKLGDDGSGQPAYLLHYAFDRD